MKKVIFVCVLFFFCQPAFAIDLDFFVYGDFDATVGAFRRAALIFNDADYLGLFFVACVFGLFSGGVTMFWSGLWGQLDGRRILQYIFYPFMGVALYTTTILNTGTMHVFDETQNKYQAVGGVPDGIVLLAGMFNKFERIVAEVASDNPATVRSNLASGTGIKLFLDAFASNPLADYPELQKSLSNLIIDCLEISMVSNGNLDLEYIRSQAPSAMAVLGEIDTNTVSTVTYSDTGAPTTRTCAAASANIQARFTAAAFDQATESLCLNAGYEIGGANAATERAACYNQLESVGRVFLGAPFAGGDTRMLFTNIAVYNTIAEGINDANVTVNGLGAREIASEGIATLAVTEDWLPQIRGGMLVTILSLMVLIAIFLVTPLFAKAMKVMFALFFFLAFWGAASSLQLMNAYDQVIFASRSIAFHAGGLEAYLMAPTTAISSLAIIGDSLTTAMMFAAALTTIFTGVSAYGFSNALAHAAGKVEGIGENQGRNITMDGKAELIDRNANANATHQVSTAMGADAYGKSHVQRNIEANVASHGRVEGIQEQGYSRMQTSQVEGIREGGSMSATNRLNTPSNYGHDSALIGIGSQQTQITRANEAGRGDLMHGAAQLESVRSSSTSQELKAHGGDTTSVDQTSLTQSMIEKGKGHGHRNVENATGRSVESLSTRQGESEYAEVAASKRQYTTPGLIRAADEKAAFGAAEHKQQVADAISLSPELSSTDAMANFGKLSKQVENNATLAQDEIPRADTIAGERAEVIDRNASAVMQRAMAEKFITRDGTPANYDDLKMLAASEQPLFSLGVMGADAQDVLRDLGYSEDKLSAINPNLSGEWTSSTMLDENDDLVIGNIQYSQGNQLVVSDTLDVNEGTRIDSGNRTRVEDKIEGNSLMNGAELYDENPSLFNHNMKELGNMTSAERLSTFEELVRESLPTSFHGNASTQDTFTFSTGSEARGGISTGLLGQIGLEGSVIGSTGSIQDNIDTLDRGAHVKIGAVAIMEKYEEIMDSTPPQDIVDDGRLSVGLTASDEARNERFAQYLQTLESESHSEGHNALYQNDVNDMNDEDSGKTGDIPRDINQQESRYHQAIGWDTRSNKEPVLTPQQIDAQERAKAENEALHKKVNMYNIK